MTRHMPPMEQLSASHALRPEVLVARRRTTSKPEPARVAIEDAAGLRLWLADNHTTSPGIWLITMKTSAGGRLPWSEIVDELLCFGWVDSLPRKLDDARTMLRCTPRKPGSAWSGINQQKAERLITEGRMTAAGLAVVEAARASGAWSRLDSATALTVPADLDDAFDAAGEAGRAFFAAFPPSVRRGLLEWIAQAKTPQTRARRVAETSVSAAKNIRANQWRPKT